jgi:hypothetical protein
MLVKSTLSMSWLTPVLSAPAPEAADDTPASQTPAGDDSTPDEDAVLDVPGPVEAHLGPELLDLRDGHPVGSIAEDHLRRIAREERHAEGRDADAEDDNDSLE